MKLVGLILPLLSALGATDQTPLTSSDDDTRIAYMPLLGFGTWNLKISPENTSTSVATAIKDGYRHIDGAKAYGNQVAVGKGIKEGLEIAGAKREEIWITSKLFNDRHDDVEGALNQTLKELDLEYLDLYLMHWPVGQYGKKGPWEWDYLETWLAMEKLLELGTVRHIGICNFAPRELFRLLKYSTIKPYNHQFEIHPYLQQNWWVEWHKANDIMVTGYSPLANTNPIYKGRSNENGDELDPHISCGDETEDEFKAAKAEFGDEDEQQALGGRPNTWPSPMPLMENPVVQSIAKRHGCTVAQVALAWGMKRGYAVIPKSSHEEYIEENWASIGCVDKLDFEDMTKMEYVGRRWLHRYNNPASGWGKKLFSGLDGNDGRQYLGDSKGELR